MPTAFSVDLLGPRARHAVPFQIKNRSNKLSICPFSYWKNVHNSYRHRWSEEQSSFKDGSFKLNVSSVNLRWDSGCKIKLYYLWQAFSLIVNYLITSDLKDDEVMRKETWIIPNINDCQYNVHKKTFSFGVKQLI